HHFASWFMMRGGNLLALSKILGHAKVSMTEKYAHLAPDHLRREIAQTERRLQAVEPLLGTIGSSGADDAMQVVRFPQHSPVAQSVEHLTVNQGVAGSSPARGAMLDSRARLLRTAVGFALVPAKAPDLRLLHCWLDTWTGIGDVVAGMARQEYDL